ncbi:MAG: HAD-IIIA family hydrolase [Planctomycetota bacterium]|nr:HAD-IIIA family hydrolase [Planctomycetota bacterium]
MRPCVFLDRDDTLVECTALPPPPPPARPGDLVDPARVRLLPGVGEGLSRLAAGGFALVVISNQGSVARGGATLADVERVNDRLRDLVRADAGVELDAVYVCPFHPDPFGSAKNAPGPGEAGTNAPAPVARFHAEHDWRKPAPGMILAAARELGLDLGGSWLIGDAPRDVESGRRAGLAPHRCLRIGEGADAPDLAGAADIVLGAHDIGEVIASGGEVCTVLMHALDAAALADERVRGTVLASARSVADRAGVRVLHAEIEGGALIVTLAAGRLAGLGLLGEVRTITDRWRASRGEGPLWRGAHD